MSETNGFSRNAELYASSAAHAETPDLELALEVLGEVDGLNVLDVATGTGHTAFFFAERLAHVFAVDINDEMLAVAQEEGERKSLSCRFLKGFANDLPFDDDNFDLVTTRVAAHHFKSPVDFVAEAWRVLKPGGRLLVIDNVVPEGETGEWINAYETRRDRTHAACLTEAQWREILAARGFADLNVQEFEQVLDYELWMKRMSVIGDDADKLWSELQGAPEKVVAFLKPSKEGARTLTLHRLIAVATKP